jgi:hypothetical protein
MAALYTVGFHDGGYRRNNSNNNFRVTRVEEGPLTKINEVAQLLDALLGQDIRQCHCQTSEQTNNNNEQGPTNKIAAIISLSSEPTTIHSKSLQACHRLSLNDDDNDNSVDASVDFPIAGSGGMSLSQIASLYDLRIVGNSGGSVASTTLTKARGWAMGLAEEWGMVYDGNATNTVFLDSGKQMDVVQKRRMKQRGMQGRRRRLRNLVSNPYWRRHCLRSYSFALLFA